MFPSAVITFRETFEAALVIGILLTYLSKTNQLKFKKYVFHGVGIGLFASVLLAIIVQTMFGGFTGKTEQLFEGILMFVTAGLLTWMILWVHRQKEIVTRLKQKMAKHIQKGFTVGIITLAATSVMREGTETVFYLKALSLSGGGNQLLGSILGIGFGLVLCYIIFKYSLRFRLQTIFQVTSILLLFFAAGLVAHGVHEFQEAGIFPIFHFDPLFNISHILSNDSFLGGLLRSLFGYTSKPTFLELLAYGFYIVFIIWFERVTDKMLLKNKVNKT